MPYECCRSEQGRAVIVTYEPVAQAHKMEYVATSKLLG